jgi:hypothetical protein
MGRDAPAVEAWVSGWDADQQTAVRWFADKAHEADPRISEAIRWRRLRSGQPASLAVRGGRHPARREVAAGNPEAVAELVREAVARQTDMLDEQEAGS